MSQSHPGPPTRERRRGQTLCKRLKTPEGARVPAGGVRAAGCVSGHVQGSLGNPVYCTELCLLNAHHHQCVPSTLARPGPARPSGAGVGVAVGVERSVRMRFITITVTSCVKPSRLLSLL